MADATPSRPGQVLGVGDPRALMLKVFGGEVLTAFDRKTIYKPLHYTRSIPNGKSAQFPVTGKARAVYHTPGTEILGIPVNHTEKVIHVEDLLVAPIFVANVDEMLNHYDIRSIYAGEQGEVLANTFDKDIARTFVLAARSAANIAGETGAGGFDVDATYDTDGAVLYAGIFDAGVAMDEKDIPDDGRFATVKPVQYALIVRSEKPIDRDLNPEGNGSIASGRVNRINNIPLMKTNNLAQEDDRSNTAIPAIRRADYSPTMAIVGHRSAVGTVNVQDVTTETEYDMRRQGTLMLSKYLKGTGVLRPEGAFELRVADPSV